MSLILIILILLLVIGAFPAWPYSQNWGYAPSSVLGVVVIIILVLVLTGRF